ncbi:hypothetical protein ABPG72_006368 [Tetrahymena utriculariae]
MGQSQSQENEDEKEDKTQNEKKKSEKVQISPYVDGMPVLQSKLQKLIKKEDNEKQQNNEVYQMKESKEINTDIHQEIQLIEQNRFQNCSDHIRQEFESFSNENKMSQRKLLEYFGLQDLEKQRLGTRFFLTCKSTLSQEKTGPYLDYSKFLKTLSMLSGNNEDGRFQFLYQLFDINLDGKIEKDEMRDILQMILDALLSVTYEDDDLKNLSKKIQGEQERMISLALDQITSEIFDSANETNSINFQKWKNWISQIEGFQQVIRFDPQANSNNTYTQQKN